MVLKALRGGKTWVGFMTLWVLELDNEVLWSKLRRECLPDFLVY